MNVLKIQKLNLTTTAPKKAAERGKKKVAHECLSWDEGLNYDWIS